MGISGSAIFRLFVPREAEVISEQSSNFYVARFVRSPAWRGAFLVAITLGFVFALIRCLIVPCKEGVSVEIHNSGSWEMREVFVYVQGARYSYESLTPGERRKRRVIPTGESGLKVGFLAPDGVQHQLVVECYFDETYSGEIAITISDKLILRVDDNTRMPYF